MPTPPDCFGKRWSATAVECKGGLDPMYENPADGTHKRERCYWYSQCASRTCASQVASNPQQQPAPMTGVTRYHQPPAPLPSRPAAPQPYPQQPVIVQPVVVAPPHQAYYGPQQVPVAQPQPGMQMLGYLSNPEPVDPNVPWYKRLGHEIARSWAKSGGHTVASFFDHFTFTQPKPPEK